MKIRALLSLAAVLTLTTACEQAILGGAAFTANEVINQEDLNLAAKNYAVADYVIQQARTYVKRDSLIVADPLTDIETPEMTATIAKLIPEQIGIRISQLGYRVDLGKVSTTPETNYLRPGFAEGEKPDFVLTGHYLRRRKGLDVKIRIVDLKNDAIVGSFDYTIKNEHQLRKLSDPQPKIVKTTPGQ